MPKLREPPADKAKRVLIAKMDYLCKMKGIDREQQRIAMHVSSATYDRRRRNPGEYKFDELQGLAQKLRVPLVSLFTEMGE